MIARACKARRRNHFLPSTANSEKSEVVYNDPVVFLIQFSTVFVKVEEVNISLYMCMPCMMWDSCPAWEIVGDWENTMGGRVAE